MRTGRARVNGWQMSGEVDAVETGRGKGGACCRVEGEAQEKGCRCAVKGENWVI